MLHERECLSPSWRPEQTKDVVTPNITHLEARRKVKRSPASGCRSFGTTDQDSSYVARPWAGAAAFRGLGLLPTARDDSNKELGSTRHTTSRCKSTVHVRSQRCFSADRHDLR